MKHVLTFLTALLAGCAHSGNEAAQRRPLTTTPSSLPKPVTSADSPQVSAFPVQYEEYYVGTLADAGNPNFAYRPGTLLVQKRTAQVAGPSADSQSSSSGPSTVSGSVDFHPDPTATEITAMVARSQRALAGLTEENERLVAALHAAQVEPPKPSEVNSPAIAPMVVADASVAKAPLAAEDRLIVVKPRENVIELDPNFFAAPLPATNNPFVQLYQPPVAFREVALVVSAAVPGPSGSAVLNDEPYTIGDRFEGLTVYRIDPDTVFLRKDAFLLACPVSEKSLKLRVP